MLHSDERTHSAPLSVDSGAAPRPRLALALSAAALAALVGLGGWWVLASMTVTEPAAFVVAPPAGATAVADVDDIAAAVADPATGTDPAQGDASASGVVAEAPAAASTLRAGNARRVDPAWTARTSAATGIPLRALVGYAGAELAMAAKTPGCGIRWSTLAALGSIESAHGTHAGSSIGADGVTRPGIFGIDLTGESSARITDTDGGAWDGKADIDRAVGPLQFIPATWETWGADGDGDGVRDPQQIDDAALAAAGYLCHYGDLSSPENWRTAIFAYNHLDSYVNAVARAANDYARKAG